MTSFIDNDILKAQKFNLLYIDKDNIKTYESTLKLKKFFKNIYFYENSEKLLNNLHHVDFDLALINIDIDKKAIFNTIKKIKTINNNIPIIICSDENNPQTLIKAIQLGINNYIKKPFKKDELEKLITKIADEVKSSQKNSLLKDFEKMVLKNSIITKLDLNGKIKYVNDSLCLLSGFKKDELLGKSYTSFIDKKENIKSLKSITKNLNNHKFTWKGKVKTINKNGKPVSLLTNINPLFDKNKKINGFLAIHIDITFEENLKEHFKNQLYTKTFNLNDAIKLNNQYEMAINQSNILSKTDPKGKITYVNDKFCEISGYKRSELIGKSHSIVRHKDTPNELFFKLWKTIKSGKTWKGIVKNSKKDGTAYFVSTTIIPIKDRDNNIKEFIGIKHDLTELFHLHNEIEETQREMLYKMGEVSEKRSKETGNHVKRVAQYSKDLALLYGLDEKEANLIFAASPMHDIGKVGIPDEILKKPDKLTPEEFEIMKSHAEVGYKILRNSKRPILKVASIIAREHHERYDGGGYPRGLKGDEIHIYGRITALADVFDALGSHRCYKRAWADEKIFDFFVQQKGKHFDPHLVDIFLENIQKFLETRDKFQD